MEDGQGLRCAFSFLTCDPSGVTTEGIAALELGKYFHSINPAILAEDELTSASSHHWRKGSA